MAIVGTRRLTLSTPLVYTTLLLYAAMTVFPVLWLIYCSVKPDAEIYNHPLALPSLEQIDRAHFTDARQSDPNLSYAYFVADTLSDNYQRAWHEGNVGRYLGNSFMVTAATVILSCLLGAMASYALSRFRFLGARPVYFLFLAGLMVPLQLAIVPLFFQMKEFHLLNSRIGLVLVYVAISLPFTTFVLTGFFRSLPRSLHESALIDGAGEFRAFWHIMLPLVRPGLLTVGVITFIGTWSEYLIAFVFLSGAESQQVRTLPLGLANLMINSQYRSDWGMAFAGMVIMMVPMLLAYLLLQRHIQQGLTMGAIKG